MYNAIKNQSGVIIQTKENQYSIGSSDNLHGLDLQNSDIIGFNGIWANDTSDTTKGEGINYKRNNNNYDSLFALDGTLFLEKNLSKENETSSGVFEIPTLVTTVHSNTSTLYSATHQLGKLCITEIRSIQTVAITNPSGANYYGFANAITYPIAYARAPTQTVYASPYGGNENAWIWGREGNTNTSTGSFYLARGSAYTATFTIHVIAIGLTA